METSYVSSLVGSLLSDPKLSFSTAAVLLLLIWRLYRFTISPLFFPNDPKEYPYWIPFIEGHLKSFYQNASRFLSIVRLHFNDTREPFAVTVAGQKWYILTNADDVSATYKINDGSLSYDIFAQAVFRVIGISKEGVAKVFQTQNPGKEGPEYPKYKNLLANVKEFQVRQLSPGKGLDEILVPAVEFIDRNLKLPVDSKEAVSLFKWISDIFVGFGQEAYFGKKLGEIEPDLVQIFQDFDECAWQVLYQYPSILCGDMLNNKSKIQSAMERYFALPVVERPGAAWLILELEKAMKRVDVSVSDSAIFFFQMYWSINGNTRKAPFWMLAYILFQPELIEIMREEIKPAFTERGINVDHLVNNCPTLNSTWDETIRITASAASVRFLTQDITIGSKTLRKGNRIMMPQRQLHFNTKIFGHDATSFEADRFMKDPGLKRHPSLRPFGGGTSLCPGRQFAKMTTLAFIAGALQRFNIVLDPPLQRFPKPDEGKPTLGLVDFEPGCDLRVRLCRRGGEVVMAED